MSIETSDCVNLISTQLVGIRRFLRREEMFRRNLAQCLGSLFTPNVCVCGMC